jgi:hypothetical protein
MSTDFIAVCDECRVRIHVGQIMAGIASFGCGSTDEPGRVRSAEFLYEHAYHGLGARVQVADWPRARLSDAYLDVSDAWHFAV